MRARMTTAAVALLALCAPTAAPQNQPPPCETCGGPGFVYITELCRKQNGTGCNGLGYRPCFACSGKGYRLCHNCGGSGLTTWVTLVNNGTPWRFQSSSTQGCGICCGTGHRRCLACTDSLKTLPGLETPLRMPGLIVCPKCDGTGEIVRRVRCPDCRPAVGPARRCCGWPAGRSGPAD